jgi:hypothetical protein
MRRREFMQGTAAMCAAAVATRADGQQASLKAEVTLPRDRVPLSFIIDDSTCLVNMGHFCMPQFAQAWPDRDEYKQPWEQWPREIPDSFVREFGEWSRDHGVKGKYSIVPYPACVGWLDRELPGWSRKALAESLELVRTLMLPNWDIHPEMITHTRVIDLKTGRPIEPATPASMENSFPQESIGTDQLTEYLAYALRVLKNCDLPCEGITTPGGFGNKMKPELGRAVLDAVQDVYGCELPHYFKYVMSGDEPTFPKLEHLTGQGTDSPRLVVNVPAGTGDWFGGWEGTAKSEGFRYSNEDATSGRMVELIEKRQPAVMLCHWPGLYCNGELTGFRDFQRVVTALESRYKDVTLWMKVSEIGRYWAAKELTKVACADASIELDAPFACDNFTLKLSGTAPSQWILRHNDTTTPLAVVTETKLLEMGRLVHGPDSSLICFRLPKGKSTLVKVA